MVSSTFQAAKPPMRPIKRLAFHATTTCSAQATAYAKCIVATYTDVTKDICKDEFNLFRSCVRESVSELFSARLMPQRFTFLLDEKTTMKLPICIHLESGYTVQ
ncbi:hypothetical protein BJ912DRAFT_580413 [Pholiota molesta]|nr:hypothetical protein BJ912DRAFT_580413 [Pholiota molesta]